MRWLRKTFGDAPFEEINVIALDASGVRDSNLAYVEPLRELHTLSLSHTLIIDAGLKHLEGLRHLRKLYRKRRW